MTTTKQNTFRSLLSLLVLIVIATAVYAITTWSTDFHVAPSPVNKKSSQLLDQSNQVEDLQANPSNSTSMTGGSSSTQLQSTQPVDNSTVPTQDPNLCHGNDKADVMCMAP